MGARGFGTGVPPGSSSRSNRTVPGSETTILGRRIPGFYDAGVTPRYESIDPDLIVYLPTGSPFPALNHGEADYLTRLIEAYTEMRFEHISDLAELDRLIQTELLAYRWGTWLGLGEDYEGKKLDPKLEEKQQKASTEIRQIKAKLGIDKVARDRARGEGSVHQRMTSLLQRAKAFNLHRCNQVERALELQNELISLTQLHMNLKEHPDEQKEMRVTAEDLVEWVWTRLKPEFQEIDEHWRTHEQSIWHIEDARLEALG